ncbi:hypothetical protein IHN32_01165 [Deinococcus sp. 14RED07]|uniref:hypothetical protein n=1 Tax=unclassified Deinococcus TaxID=2623546 RepID=UPI001E5D7F83|nr:MULTISPECIES: hypothetical protein [unclassified Deinococcus]MCD0155750.1 hypothetical protein [Deinococcus sp. 6GRE01]MCD0174566.1 hypothetical protein [Deinococcus sp. 14RED07]
MWTAHDHGKVKARRAELEARPTPLRVDPTRVTQVGKRIGSVKWLDTLDDRAQKDMQRRGPTACPTVSAGP